MGTNSNISWTDNTWNPWHGCRKVSQGCKNCYMYRDKERYGHDPSVVQHASWKKFYEPYGWKEPKKVFTCSWSDFFIEEADKWRPEAWEIIRENKQLTFQLLTKRIDRVHDCLPKGWWNQYLIDRIPGNFNNVWIGTSVESNEVLETRLFELIQLCAKVHFLSIEPLLEDVGDKLGYLFESFKDFEMLDQKINDYLHWVIVGGESGFKAGKYQARECKLEWIRKIVNVCRHYKIPVFVKQLGSTLARELSLKDWKGEDMNEWPEDIRIREFPTIK